MASGGARNRSGPQADPNSGRSEARGYKLTALPSEGYQGEVPEFPLSPAVVINEYYDDGQRIREIDDGATESRRDREAELWQWAWRTPQACAWSLASWRWQTVAMWVRTFVICESPEAKAADKASLHRFADQIGLTPAGLRENGWAIATDEVAAKAREKSEAPAPKQSSRDRMKIVGGSGR